MKDSDVMFIIASDPPEFLRGRAHQLLIVAPVVEGLLGGWSTLQGATQASVSHIQTQTTVALTDGLLQIHIRLYLPRLPVSKLSIIT